MLIIRSSGHSQKVQRGHLWSIIINNLKEIGSMRVKRMRERIWDRIRLVRSMLRSWRSRLLMQGKERMVQRRKRKGMMMHLLRRLRRRNEIMILLNNNIVS